MIFFTFFIGLLVKQMLLQSHQSSDKKIKAICDNTKGVAFYSVPHRGTQLAKFKFGSKYLVLPSPEVRQLELGNGYI